MKHIIVSLDIHFFTGCPHPEFDVNAQNQATATKKLWSTAKVSL
jgi:hypothetical protein